MNRRPLVWLLALLLAAAPLAGCDAIVGALQDAASAQETAQSAQDTLTLLPGNADSDAQTGSAGVSDGAQSAQDTLTLLPGGGETTPAGDGAGAQAQSHATAGPTQAGAQKTPMPALDENGSYSSSGDVALFLHLYGHLPDNFITKAEARQLGWPGGGLDDYAYGKCIGGDRFSNLEGLLPEQAGRRYTECDVDTLHRTSRGAKRIVFSNDGLIYYTDDHYESFTLLYGED